MLDAPVRRLLQSGGVTVSTLLKHHTWLVSIHLPNKYSSGPPKFASLIHKPELTETKCRLGIFLRGPKGMTPDRAHRTQPEAKMRALITAWAIEKTEGVKTITKSQSPVRRRRSIKASPQVLTYC